MSLGSSPPEVKLLTIEEFLALPDDGRERWLIGGEVYPNERTLSIQTRQHSRLEARIARILLDWLDSQPKPRGMIHSGNVGFRLSTDPDTLVGIDVAVVSPELVAGTPPEETYYQSAPTLAVEILSPSDRQEEIVRKVRPYLEVGSVVWVVDPDFEIIRVHRPGRQVESLAVGQELVGDPELPGFRVPISEIFG